MIVDWFVTVSRAKKGSEVVRVSEEVLKLFSND
jgi:hypothetical protein